MFSHGKYICLDSSWMDTFSKEDIEELRAEGYEVDDNDNIYNHWTDMDSISGCAYWALSKPINDKDKFTKYLEHYAFEKENQIDIDNYTLEEGEVIFVCGEEFIKFDYDEEDEEHYVPQWQKFNSIDKAKAYKETLAQERRIMIFSIKNDILPYAIKKKTDCDNAYREYQKRKVFFKGDIIITDPCYILEQDDFKEENIPSKYFFSFEKEENYPDYNNRISKQYQEELKHYNKVNEIWKRDKSLEEITFYENTIFLNFKYPTMESSTLYGDWSCTVINPNTKDILGEFCADSGMVCVYNMEDVLKYKPDFMDYLKDHSWIATIIKDFDGYVQFEIEDNSLYVCGYGNKNFKSIQTGF